MQKKNIYIYKTYYFNQERELAFFLMLSKVNVYIYYIEIFQFSNKNLKKEIIIIELNMQILI